MSESIYLCRAPDKAVVTIFNISSYDSVSGQKFKPFTSPPTSGCATCA